MKFAIRAPIPLPESQAWRFFCGAYNYILSPASFFLAGMFHAHQFGYVFLATGVITLFVRFEI